MDDIDAKIVSLLKKDARSTNATIGKAIGLGEGAVRKRIAALVSSGDIKRFTVESKSDLSNISALVFISVEESIPTEKIAKLVLSLDGARDVFEITGEYDVCALVTAEDISQVNAIIDEVRKLKHVRDTKTQIILKRWE